MTTITANSTLEEIEAAYVETASYAENNDLTAARRFVTVCRVLIFKYPRAVAFGGESVQTNIGDVRLEKARAEQWIAANQTTSARTRNFVQAGYRG